MLTVLFSTRNRALILSRVLEAFTRLREPSSGWKLVIVDNGSVDETPQIISSFAGQLPLQSVAEPRTGKNFALNTGLGFAEGDLVVFTDDDVFPRTDWLVELRKAADAQPAYSMFGGAILPCWEARPPEWIKWVEKGPVYSLTDPAWREGPIHPISVFGPNMAVRASVFQCGIRFNPSIGPCGSNYAMGSETELTLRLDRLGHKAWHVPTAVLEHFIREEQLEKPWVWRRALRLGRGHYRLLCAEENCRAKSCLGVPLYLLWRMFKQGVRMNAARLILQDEVFFRSRWWFNYFRGEAMEARTLAQRRSDRDMSHC